MTASKFAKNHGLKSLNQVCSITGRNKATLINWFNNEPDLFEVVVLGCVFKIKFGSQYSKAIEVFGK